MTEQERAEWLARAVDRLLNDTPEETPVSLAPDAEAAELLRIARSRRDAAESARELAREHEAAVWNELVSKFTPPARGRRRTRPSTTQPEQARVDVPHWLSMRTADARPAATGEGSGPKREASDGQAVRSAKRTDRQPRPLQGGSAAVVALLTLALAVFAPLAATGIEGHPLVRLAEHAVRLAGLSAR